MPNQQKDDVYRPRERKQKDDRAAPAYNPVNQLVPTYPGMGSYRPFDFGDFGQRFMNVGTRIENAGRSSAPAPTYNPNYDYSRDRWYQDRSAPPREWQDRNTWARGGWRERPMEFGSAGSPTEPPVAPPYAGDQRANAPADYGGFPMWEGGRENGSGRDYGGYGGRGNYGPGYGGFTYEQPKPQPRRYDYALTSWKF